MVDEGPRNQSGPTSRAEVKVNPYTRHPLTLRPHTARLSSSSGGHSSHAHAHGGTHEGGDGKHPHQREVYVSREQDDLHRSASRQVWQPYIITRITLQNLSFVTDLQVKVFIVILNLIILRVCLCVCARWPGAGLSRAAWRGLRKSSCSTAS